MNALLMALGVALMVATAVCPLLVGATRRWRWWPAVTLAAIGLTMLSLLAFSVAGMSYEDLDEPYPVWWLVGVGITQVQLLAYPVLLVIWAVRWVRLRRAPAPPRAF